MKMFNDSTETDSTFSVSHSWLFYSNTTIGGDVKREWYIVSERESMHTKANKMFDSSIYRSSSTSYDDGFGWTKKKLHEKHYYGCIGDVCHNLQFEIINFLWIKIGCFNLGNILTFFAGMTRLEKKILSKFFFSNFFN